MVPMHLGLKKWPFLPHNLTPVQESSVPVLKFQMAPTIHYSVQVILSIQYFNCKLNSMALFINEILFEEVKKKLLNESHCVANKAWIIQHILKKN